jgi:peptidyl-prolyl cis-trans isomerase D
VLGKVFGTKQGEMSKPIKGNQAVFIVIPESFTKASPKDDYTTEKRIIHNSFMSRVQSEIHEALKKKADIEDNRLLFF